MSQPYIGQILLAGFNFAPVGYAFCNGALLPIAQYDALFNLIGTTYGGDGQTTFALPDLRGRIPIGPGGSQGFTIGQTGGTENVTLSTTQLPQHSHAIDISALTATARCRNGQGNQLTPVADAPAIGPYTPFIDDPLAAGLTTVQAVHVTELRARINTLRSNVGLGAYPYADLNLAAGITLISAQHILDLRAALVEAYQKAGIVPLPTFDPTLAPGTGVKASHIQEVRNALVKAPPGVAGTYSNAAPDSNMGAGAVVVGGAAAAASAGGGQTHANLQPYLALTFCIAVSGIFPSQF